MVDKTVVPPARMREWRVKRGMGQLRVFRAATGFVLLSAILAAPSLARATNGDRASGASAIGVGAAAVPRFAAAARNLQASEVQTYPERPTPSQPAVPKTSGTEKTFSQPPKTEQYTLSGDRYEKAIAFSRA